MALCTAFASAVMPRMGGMVSAATRSSGQSVLTVRIRPWSKAEMMILLLRPLSNTASTTSFSKGIARSIGAFISKLMMFMSFAASRHSASVTMDSPLPKSNCFNSASVMLQIALPFASV